MQVWTGGEAGLPDIADHVALLRFTVEVRGAGGGEPVARYEVQVKG
jgi:hypothetical protein